MRWWKTNVLFRAALLWERLLLCMVVSANDPQEKLHQILAAIILILLLPRFKWRFMSMNENCLEVIVLKGETGLVQDIANLIIGTAKG